MLRNAATKWDDGSATRECMELRQAFGSGVCRQHIRVWCAANTPSLTADSALGRIGGSTRWRCRVPDGRRVAGMRRRGKLRHISKLPVACACRKVFLTTHPVVLNRIVSCARPPRAGGMFGIRCRSEPFFAVPSVAGLLAMYMHQWLLPNGPAQRPERAIATLGPWLRTPGSERVVGVTGHSLARMNRAVSNGLSRAREIWGPRLG